MPGWKNDRRISASFLGGHEVDTNTGGKMTINTMIKTDLAQDGEITPAESAWDGFFLAAPDVSDDFMSERASQTQSGRGMLETGA